jgi:hypothetical protein
MRAMAMTSARLAPGTDTSVRSLQRMLSELLPSAGSLGGAGAGPSLEVGSGPTELPRLISALVIEGRSLRARTVSAGEPAAFSGFLDGTQESRIVQYVEGLPLVHGRVGAVIRVRKNRRLATWRHEVSERLYAPRRLLSSAVNAALDALSIEVVDTTAGTDGTTPGEHPFAIRDAAIHKVQEDRERAEHRLAERWCNVVREPLFIDGGISANDRVATSGCAVGVVKSHRTLYAEGEGLQVIFSLGAGERTTVFRITSPKRTTVASWYLRLRDPVGHDPMWGLVRVEAQHPEAEPEGRIFERADSVSRSILAEAAPLALPDSRWDKMVYGIRDCEEFLRAVM